MPISQTQLAERWELSKGRISQLVSAGMPLDSFEAAERWRAERHAETGIAPSNYRLDPGEVPRVDMPADAPQPTDPKAGPALETFETILERQRILVQLSRNQYIQAVRAGSPQQSKLYASYDKTVNTLTKLKAESDRLAVIAREYIRASDATDEMRRLMSDVVNRLDKLALDVAEACNPENPARAVKVLEAWTRKVREELSRDE